jgi:hypothetical protein
MQLKQKNVERHSVVTDDRKLNGDYCSNQKTCHEVRAEQKASLIYKDHYLTVSSCKKTLIKLNLHKGRARKNRFRVMSWLYFAAGQKVSSNKKITYKVIPKEIGSND